MEQHPDSRAAPAPSAASLEADLNPAPAADNALVPHAQTPPPAAPDDVGDSGDPGVDLAAYQWVPVLRKPRKDGWTPQRQVEFIAALADTAAFVDGQPGHVLLRMTKNLHVHDSQ